CRVDAAPGISELRQVVCGAAAAFEPALLDGDGARRAVSEWSAIANAARAACDMAAARVAECGPPSGFRDTADWLARETGTSNTKAKERVRTGERLRKQAGTRKAATDGQLSDDQASLISDAVGSNPGAERELLAIAATKSHAELREVCAKKKMAA